MGSHLHPRGVVTGYVAQLLDLPSLLAMLLTGIILRNFCESLINVVHVCDEPYSFIYCKDGFWDGHTLRCSFRRCLGAVSPAVVIPALLDAGKAGMLYSNLLLLFL
ncbi:unnamed protein product [Cylicocyclus nassatus]|uniref:Uncharacterized protein n=1 Tax=Cylicocyclus nassatus TaxID=53992 RepID=A0AA36HFM3_CYLNA|nr:unnamed protein product [Cylicocyclus nassatus]